MIIKVFGLVFLSIIRTRFPKGISVQDIIRSRYGEAFVRRYTHLKRPTVMEM